MSVVTAKPTQQPQIAPTSSIPTAQPSMTGLLVEITATTTVTESLTDDEIDAIEEEMKTQFNITDDDEIQTDGNFHFVLF